MGGRGGPVTVTTWEGSMGGHDHVFTLYWTNRDSVSADTYTPRRYKSTFQIYVMM